jgi:hypothetical protein
MINKKVYSVNLRPAESEDQPNSDFSRTVVGVFSTYEKAERVAKHLAKITKDAAKMFEEQSKSREFTEEEIIEFLVDNNIVSLYNSAGVEIIEREIDTLDGNLFPKEINLADLSDEEE